MSRPPYTRTPNAMNRLRFHRLLLVSLASLVCIAVACGRIGSETIDTAALSPIIETVQKARLEALVGSLVAAHQEDTPLDCSSFEELTFEQDCHLTRDLARQVVADELESYGLDVKRQTREDPVFRTENVFAEIVGTELPKEIVLIGSHFDAFHAGADDNSSGMSVVLEAARVLSQHRFKRTVRFVGFDLEEVGLVGSTRYVASLGNEKIVASIILDTVGFTSNEPNSQTSIPGLPAPTVGDFLAVFANARSDSAARQMHDINVALELTKIATVIAPEDGAYPLVGNLMRSDHAPFWLAGKPALFLTDTANFRNPNYHTDHDTIDTLDFDFLTQVTRLSVASLAHWAGVTDE